MSDETPVETSLSDIPKAKPGRRRILIIGAVVLIFACGACGLVSVLITNNDSPTQTAERVAAVSEQVDPTEDPTAEPPTDEPPTIVPTLPPTETAAPADTPAPTDTPEPEIDPITPVNGIGITPADIPQGEPGLSVVLAGSPSRFGAVPVVVRNNTDEPVYDIEISATARDSAGSVLGTGPGRDIAPSLVPPGGVAFGRVLFGETPLDGATIEYLVSGDNSPGLIFSNRDLEIIEHNLVGGNIVGLMLNRHNTAVDLIHVTVICFDDTLTPTTARDDYTDQDRVEAGAEVPFSVDLLGDEAQCGRYLLAGGGWEAD